MRISPGVTSADCIFCRIVAGRLGDGPVLSTEDAVVIKDIAPQAPHHFLVVSREHVTSLNDAAPRLLAGLLEAAQVLARRQGFALDGYRVVINVLEQGGQTVPHLHVHVLAGRFMTWPPG